MENITLGKELLTEFHTETRHKYTSEKNVLEIKANLNKCGKHTYTESEQTIFSQNPKTTMAFLWLMIEEDLSNQCPQFEHTSKLLVSEPQNDPKVQAGDDVNDEDEDDGDDDDDGDEDDDGGEDDDGDDDDGYDGDDGDGLCSFSYP
ncbi:hypothetical protein STEG23_020048 [Scotinomys teguina]